MDIRKSCRRTEQRVECTDGDLRCKQRHAAHRQKALRVDGTSLA
jgi:hypothetical protein